MTRLALAVKKFHASYHEQLWHKIHLLETTNKLDRFIQILFIFMWCSKWKCTVFLVVLYRFDQKKFKAQNIQAYTTCPIGNHIQWMDIRINTFEENVYGEGREREWVKNREKREGDKCNILKKVFKTEFAIPNIDTDKVGKRQWKESIWFECTNTSVRNQRLINCFKRDRVRLLK